jgi:tetratricopeptide (TPR) repeat protein
MSPAVAAAQRRTYYQPYSPAAHVRLGNQYAMEGLPGLAIAEFQAALHYDPWYGEAILGSAAVTAEAGDLHRALALSRRAVLAMPDEPIAYLNLGQIHLRRRECAQAQEAFNQARRLDPSNEAAWLGLITACLEGGDRHAAAKHAKEALRRFPHMPEMLTNYGLVMEALGEYEAAEREYRAALRADPENALPLNNLAYMFASIGTNLDEALELARRANQLRPHNASCLDTLGYVLYRQGQYREAAAVLGEAKALRPGSGNVRYHLGLALQALGHADAAAAEFLEVVRRDPNAPGAADANRRWARLSGAKTAR